LWESKQGEAISYGTLFHEMMAKVYQQNDVDNVVQNFAQQGLLTEELLSEVKEKMIKIVHHPLLITYFTEDAVVFNEREIVTHDGQIIIPDRLVFTNDKEVVIIDYKTGEASAKHQQQILKYGEVLKSMGFKIKKRYLIYIGEEIVVKEVY